jgi:hypothetical protein
MSHWTLTEDGLPFEQYVLAWNGRQFFAAFFTEGKFLEAGLGGPIEGVTHWTPFPLAQDLSFRYQRQPIAA